MEQRFIEHKGQRVAIYIAGHGPAVVLIHGNSSSARIWKKQFDSDLVQEFQLVALDLAGCGDSGKPVNPEEDYSIAGHVAKVKSVIDELGLANPVLVGNSLGGHIAMELAPIVTDLAGLMIFGAPPIRLPLNLDEAFIPTIVLEYGFSDTITKSQVLEMGRILWHDTIPEIFVSDYMATDPDFRKYLGLTVAQSNGIMDEAKIVNELQAPIAVLQGSDDNVANLDYLTSLEIPTLWKNEIVIKEKCCHYPQWETADWFNVQLIDFISYISK